MTLALPSNPLALAGFAALTTGAQLLGARASTQPASKAWYRRLRKPPQTPPDPVFGLVWPVLYGLTAWSGYRLWERRDRPGARTALALWGAHLAANASWSPVFFGKRRARAALGVLSATFVGLAAYAWRAAKVDRTAAWLVAPTLAWLSFAATLNVGIVNRNPRVIAG